MKKSSVYDPKKAPSLSYKDILVRTRKFKKPMDSLKQRNQRIDMVVGMQQLEQGVINKKKEEKPAKSVFAQEVETDSSLTHKEIEEIAQKYNLSWRQVFQLDAEFWSLITIQEEDKEKEESREDNNQSELGDKQQSEEKK